MKNKIVLPSLFIGLVLAGCTRTSTDTAKVSSNDPAYGTQPARATYQTAADKTAIAQKDANAQAQVAAAMPAPPPDASKEATASTPFTSTNASVIAATPTTPASTTPPFTTFDSSAPALNPTATTPASTEIASIAADAKPAIANRITEWKLSPDEIKGELATSGRILRLKPAGAGEPTGPMDSVLVSEINGKLKADTETSALKIKVEVDTGVVTLNGTARSLDQIGHAVALALDTGGVTQAISLIKLDATPQP